MPQAAAPFLRQHGHVADTVYDENLGGALDGKVIDFARQENRALITLDLDFSDIRTYPPQNFPGIVILRPRYQSALQIMALLETMLYFMDKETVDRSLWVIDPRGLRIRTTDI
jgi:predicted nuclease of predicted toxin-antitoxin system